LRALQAEALRVVPQFVDQAEDLPDAPLFLIANEFFDALPIRQFVRSGDLWAERVIGLDGDALTFGLSPLAPLPELDHRLAETRDGDLVEICRQARLWIEPLARRIKAHGGAALLIDYGGGPSLGDTFQAMQGHGARDPLADPGQADLTAHVDFVALGDLARAAGVAVSGILPQGQVLNALGIGARAARLAQSLTGERLRTHKAAYDRLTLPSEMGTLFKAMALYPKGQKPPPGFD
jgi:SAM-dependent MidA family methyltransferase